MPKKQKELEKSDNPSADLSDVLSCPFCGEFPTVGYGKVKCNNEKCQVKPKVKDWYVDNCDAISAWNQRAA